MLGPFSGVAHPSRWGRRPARGGPQEQHEDELVVVDMSRALHAGRRTATVMRTSSERCERAGAGRTRRELVVVEESSIALAIGVPSSSSGRGHRAMQPVQRRPTSWTRSPGRSTAQVEEEVKRKPQNFDHHFEVIAPWRAFLPLTCGLPSLWNCIQLTLLIELTL